MQLKKKKRTLFFSNIRNADHYKTQYYTAIFQNLPFPLFVQMILQDYPLTVDNIWLQMYTIVKMVCINIYDLQQSQIKGKWGTGTVTKNYNS